MHSFMICLHREPKREEPVADGRLEGGKAFQAQDRASLRVWLEAAGQLQSSARAMGRWKVQPAGYQHGQW